MIQTILNLDCDTTADEVTIACGEKPQSRMEHFGAAAMSDTELVATILQGNGTRAEDALATASRLIAEAGSIVALASWHATDYQRVRGIGRMKGTQLLAVSEIARRMMRTGCANAPMLNRADLIYAHMKSAIIGLEVEKFWVLCLNRKNRLLKQVEVTSGTATAALAHPREVFRPAIRESASAIVCIHNHPSGDPAPSLQDVQVTQQLREAAKMIDITLVDHVIGGRPEADPLGRGFYSFRAAGMI